MAAFEHSGRTAALDETRTLDALEETSTLAVLIGYTGPPIDQVYRVADGENSIGRDPNCTIVIDDPYASRRAARLVARDGAFALENLSENSSSSMALR